MKKRIVSVAVAGMLLGVNSSALIARQALEVGTMAPDFEITGATRFGVVTPQVKLSDFKGKTVVVAFFPKARTRG